MYWLPTRCQLLDKKIRRIKMCLSFNKLSLKVVVKNRWKIQRSQSDQCFHFVEALCHLNPDPNTRECMVSCFKTLLCLTSLTRTLFLWNYCILDYFSKLTKDKWKRQVVAKLQFYGNKLELNTYTLDSCYCLSLTLDTNIKSLFLHSYFVVI